jgi:hypothetical protein
VENYLLNEVVRFEKSFLVREFGQVVRRLGVIRGQRLQEILFFLLCRELLLVQTGVVLVHILEVEVVFQVLAGFRNGLLLAFLALKTENTR